MAIGHEPHLALHIEDLTVAYQHRPVLWDIDVDVGPGTLTTIIGPNGAGKSTLIKSALGLVKPTAGHVFVHGLPIKRARQMIGYVPQRNSVDWDFPATTLEVVLMGLYGKIGFFRRVKKRHKEQARAALAQLGMADYADRQIGQLSGGQQQRVFLARALVQEACLYLMDEPFTGVDATTEQAIILLLQSLRDDGKTVVVVHHDLLTVRDYFDYAILLNVRVVAQGAVDSVFTRDNLRRTYGGQTVLSQQALRTTDVEGE